MFVRILNLGGDRGFGRTPASERTGLGLRFGIGDFYGRG